MSRTIQNQVSAKSSFVPYLSFKENASELLENEYFMPLARNFFEKKGIPNYELLASKNLISNNELKIEPITYYYDIIIGEITKDNNGKIIHTFKYAFVFDKENVWDKINDKPYKECEINGEKILYGEITLAGKPIFYYIFVELQNILSFLKKNEDNLK